MPEYNRLPPWMKKPAPDPLVLERMKRLLDSLSLHTVCEGAQCPNQGECFSRRTATFMILGDTCTRNCTFCAVNHGRPGPLDKSEPEHVTEAVKALGLKHVVITSVTRDDLDDGGAVQFARCVTAIQHHDPSITVEVLVPDFKGSLASLQTVLASSPTILNHNIETVPGLYHRVRPQARYERSIELLRRAKGERPDIITKSGFMLGFEETQEEVLNVMRDLREAGVNFLTIGQYLRPSPEHHEVVRFIPPEEFQEYEKTGESMGFDYVASGPFLRSSFHAADMLKLSKSPIRPGKL